MLFERNELNSLVPTWLQITMESFGDTAQHRNEENHINGEHEDIERWKRHNNCQFERVYGQYAFTLNQLQWANVMDGLYWKTIVLFGCETVSSLCSSVLYNAKI